MIISLIVAMSENRGIGNHDQIPWRLSADLKQFKTLTMGRHLIVGRKTCESIGKPLPGRAGVVITQNSGYEAEGYDVVHSLEDAIALARQRGETEVFIGGGAGIYAQALEIADRIYLTLVHTEMDADTFFPEFDESQWKTTKSWQHGANAKNQYAFTFKMLERRFPKNMRLN